jgi:thymidylate synthase (FAD)
MEKKEVGKKYSVLGNGYVELCDYMGNDETVVRCARQSYGKDKDELTDEKIDKQIKEMMMKGHTSPFEQVVFQFHLKMPIFVARQWVRFRTARLNEISGRYTKFSEEDFYVPQGDSLEKRNSYKDSENTIFFQEKTDKTGKLLIDTIKDNNSRSYETYEKLFDNKLPKELSRLALPLTLMTELYWQMDLHNLLHFLELRMEEHAQKEIREYALIIYKIINEICPISIKHFTEYKFNSMTIGEKEIIRLYELIKSLPSYYLTNVTNENEGKNIFTKIVETYQKIQDRNKTIKNT